MPKRKTFYYSEKDFINGEFPNIEVLDTRIERKNDNSNGFSIFVCKCKHCGEIFEIPKRDLARTARNCTTRAKRVKVTCDSLFKKSLFCNRSAYINKKFNHLMIKDIIDEPIRANSRIVCECDCGNATRLDGTPLIFQLGNIKNGMTKSCGCLRSQSAKKNASRPMKDSGVCKSKERLYTVWKSMLSRCYNQRKKDYPHYGGRGITVCKMWRESYVVFRRWALKNGYDPNAPYGACTLDRIDNNKGYRPSNCRWVDSHAQNTNKVNTIMHSYHGREMNAYGWSKYLNIDYQELLNMLHQGMSIGQAIKKHKSQQNTDSKEKQDLE